MTLRAVILGLLGATLLASLGYLNDMVLQLESVVAGHQLPISVFLLVLLLAGAAWPLGLLRRSWRLAPAELAVVTTLLLVSCSIPARGLMEAFTPTVAMPAHWYSVHPGWRKHGLMDYLPPEMLAGGGQYDDRVLGGFLSGLRKGNEPIGLGDVPWAQWAPPLKTWLPLVFLMTVCTVCLGLVVHRQWTQRERLRYPIADLAGSLLEGGEGEDRLLCRRLFWIGLGAVLCLHLVNGFHVWQPDSIEIPMMLDLRAIRQRYPAIGRAPWGAQLLTPTIYPTVIAFSFFVASDISLSFGLAQPAVVALAMILTVHGVDISSDYMSGGPTAWQRFGSYLAFAAIVLYVGRRHYRAVLTRALGLGARGEVLGYEAWACRIFLLAAGLITAKFILLGLDWPLAVLTVLLMVLTFLMIARISAETGLFFIQPRWQPFAVLLGLLGGYAMGPQAMMIVAFLCAVISLDPSQSVLPFFINGLRLCDRFAIRPARTAGLSLGAYGLGLAGAVVVVLWANYDRGVPADAWGYRRTPCSVFNAVTPQVDTLALSGELDESRGLTAVQRFVRMDPSDRFLWSVGAGFVLVLVFGALRLRLPWWPLHPVMFLVWATWPAVTFSFSFLLGWLVKQLVARLGGSRMHRAAKPLMIGIIAGELLGGAVFMVFGAVYHAVTGLQPEKYTIFPH
ncbi:MAG TPA: hypothetical protein PK082_04885 [Phycisphaerae bacterium]|nr:hypothetical protein [Phycisphaerae bacterium]